MDIKKLKLDQLNELKALIDLEIVARQASEKDDLFQEITALAQARGYSLEDLVGKRAKRRAGAARKQATIRYQHPTKKDLVWSGRGRHPAWVKEWLEQGKALEKLAVK